MSCESKMATAGSAAGSGSGDRALLLGMVYANHSQNTPNVGQEYRDRLRCLALEDLGYEVYTLDDKHLSSEAVPQRHCMSNFCDARRMDSWLQTCWKGNATENEGDDYMKGINKAVNSDVWRHRTDFVCIVLDYFFSPNSWSKVRWGSKFFKETLPLWAKNGMLRNYVAGQAASTVWLPNIQHVDEMLTQHAAVLSPHFIIEAVAEPRENPLYNATSLPHCHEKLLLCREKIVNETQLPYLEAYSGKPFFRLTLRPTSPSSSSSSFSSSTAKATSPVARRGRPAKVKATAPAAAAAAVTTMAATSTNNIRGCSGGNGSDGEIELDNGEATQRKKLRRQHEVDEDGLPSSQ